MVLIATFVALVFLYSLVSRRLERTVITAPILFTAAGALLASSTDALNAAELDRHGLLLVAELGLVMLLFTDASRVSLRLLNDRPNLPGRLLSAGMLLTIALGALCAMVVLGQLSWWEAGILAAILAPTDAGLGQVIVNSPLVPQRIREALNVEAGLNDGLSVPFMMFFIALAASQGEASGSGVLTRFLVEQLGYGTLIGLGVGLAGGWLLERARRKAWMAEGLTQLGVVALPLACVLASEATGASMFIAAFVAGLAAQAGFRDVGRHSVEFTEEWGQLLNYFVFFLFGGLVARTLPEFDLGGRALRRPEPDARPHAAGGDRARGHRPRPLHGALHGLVRSTRTRLHRARARLSRQGHEPARGSDASSGGHGDGAPQHRRARPERLARDQALRGRDRCTGQERTRASVRRSRHRAIAPVTLRHRDGRGPIPTHYFWNDASSTSTL